MKLQATILSLILLGIVPATIAADDESGPRTGYFETDITLHEMLGAERAASLSDMIAADEKLKWAIYVPKTYTPAKPAGVMAFVTFSNSWGGSTKAYNDVLDDKNIIWAGVIGAGDKKPLNERMMRLLLTPTFLAREYVLDPDRMYVGGTSGGAHVATILATSKPQLFKGGLFVGGAMFWKSKEPAAIDQVRQNRYVFISGSKNPNRKEVETTAEAYLAAGVEHTKYIEMPNVGRKAPTSTVIESAIEYLDGQDVAEPDE
jgi:hypothetical protein